MLVVQDWGGLIGLTLPMAAPERFEALLVMNTTLGTGDAPLAQGFLDWRAFSNRNPDMDIAGLMKRACPHLSDGRGSGLCRALSRRLLQGGRAALSQSGAGPARRRRAPRCRAQARHFWRERWTGKSLMAIGMKDPVLGPPVMRALHADIRNCPPPIEIAEGGHFVQEWGEPIAEAAVLSLMEI